MSKRFLVVFLLIGVVTILIALNTWNMRRMNDVFSQIGLPKFEEIKSDQWNDLVAKLKGEKPTNISEKEYISPDGKLKVKYTSDWIELSDEKILEKIVPQRETEKQNLKLLFLAQKIMTTGYARLIIMELNFSEEKNIETIIEEMIESNNQQGWKMEVLKSDLKEGEETFEARYTKTGGDSSHSQEKVLLLSNEKKAYLIAFIVLEKDWPDFSKEADAIISSAQLNQ